MSSAMKMIMIMLFLTLTIYVMPNCCHRYRHFRPDVPRVLSMSLPLTPRIVLPGQPQTAVIPQTPTIPQIPAIVPQQQMIIRPVTGEAWQPQPVMAQRLPTGRQPQPVMVQRLPIRSSRCRLSRGCAAGEECVYADQWICPDWIPNLNCQCRQGCRYQNTFIPFGRAVTVDRCGNKCSCLNVYGAPECSYESC